MQQGMMSLKAFGRKQTPVNGIQNGQGTIGTVHDVGLHISKSISDMRGSTGQQYENTK